MKNISKQQRLDAERRFNELKKHPHLRAQAIADHYTKIAMVADDLRKMTSYNICACGPPSEIVREVDAISERIAEYHLQDFGIPLDWDGHFTITQEASLTKQQIL